MPMSRAREYHNRQADLLSQIGGSHAITWCLYRTYIREIHKPPDCFFFGWKTLRENRTKFGLDGKGTGRSVKLDLKNIEQFG